MPGQVSENSSGVLHIRPLQGIANDTLPCQNFDLVSFKQNAYTSVHCRETSDQVDLWEVMVTAR